MNLTRNWTTDLTEIRREVDSERIGYLRPTGGDQWEPLNLLGMPLSEPADQVIAENRVREYSMPSLIEPLWCMIPRPLVQEVTDARSDFEEAWWDRVMVVEANPKVAVVRPYAPMNEDKQWRTVTIHLPAYDVLKFREPQNNY